MKNSEHKESTVITPEVVSHQVSSPLPGENYSKPKGSGIGGKAGLVIGSVAICGLGFVAGMQMNNMRHGSRAHGQAGGTPEMSRHQDGQHLGRAQDGDDNQNRPNNGQAGDKTDQNQGKNNQPNQSDRLQGQSPQQSETDNRRDGGVLNSNQSQPDARQQAPLGPNHGSEPRGKSQQGEKLQGQQPPQPRQGNGQRHHDNAQPQPVNKQ